MDTMNTLFEKLYEMSHRTLNPHHRIMLNEVRNITDLPIEILMLRLATLKQQGKIQIHETDVISISLTKQGIHAKKEHNGQF